MSEHELRTFCSLLMVSDPWPLSEDEHHTMLSFADQEARRHGYDDWVDAYHSLPGTSIQTRQKNDE